MNDSHSDSRFRGQTRASPRALLALALGAVAVLAVLAIQSRSSSADPAPTASASAAASAAAPALPRFDAEPFSDEKTPRPTLAEWKAAQQVSLTDAPPSDCNAYRLREWVKIHCSMLTASIALIGGSTEGIALWVDRPPPDSFPAPRGGEVIFPVRRGDRRVIEWSTFGESYEGVGFPMVAFMISESWAADEPAPRIIAP